jgi:uncharacterized protein YaaQ
LKGAIFPITDVPLTVGRAADNQVCLDDELASRRHFTVQIRDGGVWLKDGDTPNGTWILGRAYTEKRLQQGDRIKCGSTTFLYLEHEDSEDALLDIINDETDRNREMDTLRADYTVRGDAAIYYKEVSKVFVEMAKSLNAVLNIAELQIRLLDFAFEMTPALRGAIVLNGHREPRSGRFRFADLGYLALIENPRRYASCQGVRRQNMKRVVFDHWLSAIQTCEARLPSPTAVRFPARLFITFPR